MTYAGERRVCDADSHLMELPDFLRRHADAEARDRLPTPVARIEGLDGRAHLGRPGHPPERVAELRALGSGLLRGPKWHAALGAFNAEERGLALDLLGFEQQVVFASYCATALFPLRDRELRRSGIRAHNRAMAEFCAGDRRLRGVGLLALDDPAAALREVEHAHALGLRLLWLPAEAPGGRSPGHPAHDPVWARLAELRVPFILHVGSAPLSIDAEWMNDGHPERPTARGQAEVVGSKDMTVIYQPAERFVSVLILDGVLERFPALRGGVIELGAGWVPAMLRRLDQVAEIWSRPEPHLAAFTRPPSEQARAQLRFTPYPFEDVGRLILESFPELYLFSTDYPHAEGGRDPLARFERSLDPHDAETKRRFYADNFIDLFHG